ncbi:hypothetical protein ANCDUO_24097 [Ancylostoma duodenale]|uniref:Peptidase family A16 n=1 Tax=Ancylostoma duodenale TaxID=51022 RepID=A0A0C2FBE2_9BILA|nr:hypothetical protein ANCDUO_24097 [Ancylostoma duodenale]
MDEYQLHWKNQDGDGVVLRAKNLLAKLQLAQKQIVDLSQQTSEDSGTNSLEIPKNSQNNFVNNPSQTRPFPTPNQTEINPCTATKTSTNQREAISLANTSVMKLIRLPKFELPRFNGELEDFPEYWDVFSVAVHNNNSVPYTLKFLHLRNCLQGDAALVIRGLSMTGDAYNNAISLLHQRYRRPNFTGNALVNKLKEIEPPSGSAQSQRNTFSMVSAIMIQLNKLEDNSESTAVMQLISEKFPEYTRSKLAKQKHKHGKAWKTSQLLAALDAIVEQQEAVNYFK